MLLEVGLARGDELDGNKLESALLKAGDDGANKTALNACKAVSICYLGIQATSANIPSGLILKLRNLR